MPDQSDLAKLYNYGKTRIKCNMEIELCYHCANLLDYNENVFHFSAINSVIVGLANIAHLAAMTDGTVVIAGKEDGDWRLKQFNMQKRTEIYDEKLIEKPGGLAEINLGGKVALAVSYR